MVLAIVIVVDRRVPLTPSRIWLAAGAMMFAAASKYTFLLPAVVAVTALLAAARSDGQLQRSLLALSVCALLLPGQVFVRNLWLYGDPVSPFLEVHRAGADPAVIAFADHLSSLGSSRSLRDLALLPFRLMATRSMGGLPTVLGLGLLAPLFTTLLGTATGTAIARRLVLAAVAVSALIVGVGRLSARDLMEVYLLLTCAAVIAPRFDVFARGWRIALIAQAAVTLMLVTYGAIRALPAAVSASARHAYMRDAADEYASARWVDSVVPADAVVMAELRAAALFERPFVSWEYARFLAMAPLPDADRATRLRNSPHAPP
jgi:hypothetical protein